MPARENRRVARDGRVRVILLLAILTDSRQNTGSVDRLICCLNAKCQDNRSKITADSTRHWAGLRTSVVWLCSCRNRNFICMSFVRPSTWKKSSARVKHNINLSSARLSEAAVSAKRQVEEHITEHERSMTKWLRRRAFFISFLFER